MPGSSAKPGSTTLGWRPGGRPFRLLVTADAYPHLRAAVDAGSSSTKVTRSGSGWPAAWTESPPTSSPPGVATTTNRTRGLGLDDAVITEDRRLREAKKAVTAAEKTLRDARRLERLAAREARERLRRAGQG
jgi:hypothetical protein